MTGPVAGASRIPSVAAPREAGESDATRADLVRLIYDGEYEREHADVRELLLDPIFDPREGLSLPEAGRRAYERCRVVHARLERPVEIVRNPGRLFALAGWFSLL